MRLFCCFIVLGVMSLVDAKHHFSNKSTNTVTTAKPVEPSSARPTTLMGFIQVRQEDFYQAVTEDIFNTKKSGFESRRGSNAENKIWKWDHWCLLQPRIGNCGRNKTKFYYNARLDQCMPFTHSGCTGPDNSNKNRFDSIAQCEQRCKGASVMPANHEEASVCEIQPDSGRCLGSHDMFYYDINEVTCKKFVYGGCGGNLNKFQNMKLCLAFCEGYGKNPESESESVPN